MPIPKPISYAKELLHTREDATIFTKALSYGYAGSGKTHFVGSFPAPFIIDTEGGLKTLQRKDVLYWPAPTDPKNLFDTILQIITDAESGAEPLKDRQSLIIDSFTALAELLYEEIMRYPPAFRGEAGRDPTIQKGSFDDWLILKQRCLVILKRLRMLPMHVCVTCGVELEKNDVTGEITKLPAVLGSTRTIIAHNFDEVYFMENREDGKKSQWVAHLATYRGFIAKSRSNVSMGGQRVEVINPSFKSLQDFYEGRK